MQGDKVVVRDAWNRALIRRVWEALPKTVHCCTEERYQRLMKDASSDIFPVGFPRRDVYEYSPDLELLCDGREISQETWDTLPHYQSEM